VHNQFRWCSETSETHIYRLVTSSWYTTTPFILFDILYVFSLYLFSGGLVGYWNETWHKSPFSLLPHGFLVNQTQTPCIVRTR
jgi:hypothetical protein